MLFWMNQQACYTLKKDDFSRYWEHFCLKNVNNLWSIAFDAKFVVNKISS